MKGIIGPGAGLRTLRVIMCASGLLIGSLGYAEEEAQLKAAFVYNFTKYVIWPIATEQASGSLRVCALGQHAFTDELAQLNGREVRSFELEVVRIAAADAIDDCHLIYISGTDSRKVLAKARGKAILTISDEADFVTQGGIIGLLAEGRRIRFDINLNSARESQLQISSRLLQLARRVE